MTTGLGWIVARTKPGREAWAAENVANQGYTFYFPRTMEQRKGVACPRPLFASYLFVQTPGHWRFLLGTFGIAGVVLFGESPAIVREDVLNRIRVLEVDGLVVLPPLLRTETKWAVGQQIRVRGGVFSGCTGIYEGSSPKQRERVLLDFLGRKTSVLFATEMLEAA